MTADARPSPHPSPEEVERSKATAREHQPSMFSSVVLACRPCLSCDEPWPCRAYHHSIHTQAMGLPVGLPESVPPTDEAVARAERVLAAHRPDGGYARPCLACGDTWPCPPYRAAREVHEQPFVDVMVQLPDRYADRLSADELAPVREYCGVGEWDEALDLLVAILRKLRVPITADERAELRWLAEWSGLDVGLPEPAGRHHARRSI